MIPLTRTRTTVAACLLILGLAACSADGDSDTADDSPSLVGDTPGSGIDAIDVVPEAADLLPDGVDSITIALTDQTPPSGFVAEDGSTVIGVDADMAVLLGQALGIEVETVGTPFDQIIPGIEAGRYDMTIAAMSPTQERMEVLDFVDYFRTGTNIGVPVGNPDDLSLDSLCGRTVAVLKGSVQEGKIVPDLSQACEDAGEPPLKPQSYPNQQETVLSVTSGRVDAAVQSAPPLAWAKKQGAEIDLGVQGEWTTVALGTDKDGDLGEAVPVAIQAILDSESYSQVLAKWGLDDFGVTEAKINNVTY